VIVFAVIIYLQVKKVEFTVQQLEGKADGLDKLAAAGNIKETANLVASISLVLNVQTEEKGEEDLVKSKEVHTYPFSGLKIFCSKMVATYAIHSIRKGKIKHILPKGISCAVFVDQNYQNLRPTLVSKNTLFLNQNDQDLYHILGQ